MFYWINQDSPVLFWTNP